MAGPVLPSSDGRAKTVLIGAGGFIATIAVVAGIVLLFPSGDDGSAGIHRTTTTRATETTVEGALGEPSAQTTTTEVEQPAGPVQLFESGADEALAEMIAAAGDPDDAIEVAIYPTYAFLSYRDPAHPNNIDRRSWRDGHDMDDAAKNPIDDRLDGDTEPQLFRVSEVDLSILPALIDDAASRFTLDVAVTHVLIDRFLPFDRRVLIRVYATPTDGRSGGGYVQYTLTGTYVKVIE